MHYLHLDPKKYYFALIARPPWSRKARCVVQIIEEGLSSAKCNGVPSRQSKVKRSTVKEAFMSSLLHSWQPTDCCIKSSQVRRSASEQHFTRAKVNAPTTTREKQPPKQTRKSYLKSLERVCRVLHSYMPIAHRRPIPIHDTLRVRQLRGPALSIAGVPTRGHQYSNNFFSVPQQTDLDLIPSFSPSPLFQPRPFIRA
jgi:hypothetical protein